MTTTKPWSGRGTTRPGEFRAYCHKGVWVPLSDLLGRPGEEQPDTTQTRWDKKLKTEVALVQCDFATTDRDAYEQHMRAVHGARHTHGSENGALARSVKPWRGPRLPDPRGGVVMPLQYQEEAGELANTCARCGSWPVTTFNDRCLSCHDAALAPAEAGSES